MFYTYYRLRPQYDCVACVQRPLLIVDANYYCSFYTLSKSVWRKNLFNLIVRLQVLLKDAERETRAPKCNEKKRYIETKKFNNPPN